MGRIELAYARMATLAGLTMPDYRLLNVQHDSHADEFFAVKRFDRDGNTRHHVISLSGYIYASHRLPSVSYETVIHATRNITRSTKEVEKAFCLVRTATQQWQAIAAREGVSEEQTHLISTALQAIDQRLFAK